MRKQVSWNEIAVGQQFGVINPNGTDCIGTRVKTSGIHYTSSVTNHNLMHERFESRERFIYFIEVTKTYKEVFWEDIKIGEYFSINEVDKLDRKKLNQYEYELLVDEYVPNGRDNVYNHTYLDYCTLKIEVKEEKKEEKREEKNMIKIKNLPTTVSIKDLKVGQQFIFPTNKESILKKVSHNQFAGVMVNYEGKLSLSVESIYPTGHGFENWDNVYPVKSAKLVDNNIEVVLAEN